MRAGLLLLLVAGCDEDPDPCADRRDLLRSDAGLVVTADEHPDGWGRRACFQCHPAWTLHTVDCIADVALGDIELARAEDCVDCHGANGVPAWTGEERE